MKGQIFWVRVRAARKELNMTQKDMAVCLNITQGAYSNYENKNRQIGLDMIVQLALVLKLDPDYLLGFSDIPKKNSGY